MTTETVPAWIRAVSPWFPEEEVLATAGLNRVITTIQMIAIGVGT